MHSIVSVRNPSGVIIGPCGFGRPIGFSSSLATAVDDVSEFLPALKAVTNLRCLSGMPIPLRPPSLPVTLLPGHLSLAIVRSTARRQELALTGLITLDLPAVHHQSPTVRKHAPYQTRGRRIRKQKPAEDACSHNNCIAQKT